jgi:hypothetical protein
MAFKIGSLTTEESRNWKPFCFKRVYGRYNHKVSGKWWLAMSLL